MSVRAMPQPRARTDDPSGVGAGRPQVAKKRGSGYSGADSTRPTQAQESDFANMGGTAPGGTVAFMGAASQWATSKNAVRANFPTGSNVDPIGAAKMQHVGLADEAPSEKGDVPVHPGLRPGLFRTARDANYKAPDGQTPTSYTPLNDATANDGRYISGGSVERGRHRGESPEIVKQTRGTYRP